MMSTGTVQPTDQATSRFWPIESEKLYKLAHSFRKQAAQSDDYTTRQRFLAHAAYFDDIALDAEYTRMTPH